MECRRCGAKACFLPPFGIETEFVTTSYTWQIVGAHSGKDRFVPAL